MKRKINLLKYYAKSERKRNEKCSEKDIGVYGKCVANGELQRQRWFSACRHCINELEDNSNNGQLERQATTNHDI